MSRGAKITLLLVGGLIVIGLIVYFIFVPLFPSGQPATNVNTPIANTNNQELNSNTPAAVNVPPPAELSAEAKRAAAARIIAQTFAARLATYTNQNGLSNLSDLRTLATPAVWSYLDGEYRAALERSMPSAKDHYAVTSTAVNANVVVTSETEVSATVPLQKVESGAVSKTSYPTLDLKLKLINGAWLVSWMEWGK